ncbi:MAG: hypothetical protein QXW83_03980 [Nitrososphaerales archaeon]
MSCKHSSAMAPLGRYQKRHGQLDVASWVLMNRPSMPAKAKKSIDTIT